MTQHCGRSATTLTRQAQDLSQALQKVMRRFGRQCRGQGQVFVKLGRQTAQVLLDLGQPIATLGQQAQQRLAHASTLSAVTCERLAQALTAALSTHAPIRTQSTRLTQGKKLCHGTIVNAYDRTIAPIVKGKRNCPAQFGRKPGLVSDPAPGFIFATLVPQGNPSDPSDVLPLLDKVALAITRVPTRPRLQIHSVAGDLGRNAPVWREALHARGILTVGIPKTIEPIPQAPSPEVSLAILNEAGFNRKRTPHQVQ